MLIWCFLILDSITVEILKIVVFPSIFLLSLLQEITASSTWEDCKHLVEGSQECRYCLLV